MYRRIVSNTIPIPIPIPIPYTIFYGLQFLHTPSKSLNFFIQFLKTNILLSLSPLATLAVSWLGVWLHFTCDCLGTVSCLSWKAELIFVAKLFGSFVAIYSCVQAIMSYDILWLHWLVSLLYVLMKYINLIIFL